MKVLIIEDEQPAANRLQRLIRVLDSNISITETIGSVEDAVNWLHGNPPPDLIFMDIQLEDGICFDIFEQVELKTPVIFTTTYDQYALKAFRVNSVDYLLKPISGELLRASLEKYKEVFDLKVRDQQINSLIKQLNPSYKERFLVRVGERFRSVPVNTVSCFYIHDKYNFLLTEGGISYGIDPALDSIEQLLDPVWFFRVNRKTIVNYAAITEVIAYSGSRLKIALHNWKETEDIIVSRERVSKFKNWMDR